MTEILCAKTEIDVFDSVKETETLIWENASPTASFANGRRVLNESMAGYDKIKIVFRPFNAISENALGVVEIPVETITRFQNNENQPQFGLNGWGASYQYTRGVYVPDSDAETLGALYFLHCYRVNASNTSDNYCVPLYVYGIKLN